MKNPDLEKIQNIHFIGIGGIGISAIARMMLLGGKKVSGSDPTSYQSPVANDLKQLGAKIFDGQRAENIPDNADMIIYTTAITDDNPELIKAKGSGVPVLTYPQALGLVSKNKYTIAVSGTHGKTTTTAMLSKILRDANLDPTVIVGSLLSDSKSNFIAGKSDLFICEACEYKRAFLNLNPKIIVITNIDEDHLDYYKNLNEIQETFTEFVLKLGKNDFLICNASDPILKPVVKKAKCKIIDYLEAQLPSDMKLQIPGDHNIQNAQAAMAVANILGVNQKQAANSLKEFKSVWRRFEHKGETENGALVYDDYAHHPTEIQASLKGAREFFGNKKIWCIFQPHLFSRTKVLINDFAKSFNDANEVIIANIYAAREKEDESINAKKLVEKIKGIEPQSKTLDPGFRIATSQRADKVLYKNPLFLSSLEHYVSKAHTCSSLAKIKKHRPNVQHINSFKKIENFLRKHAEKDDVIITMGAGDIFKVGENLTKKKGSN